MNPSRFSSCTRAVVGVLAVAAAQCACAGVFSVTPVRIYMTPKDRAIAVTITNEADEPVVLQADVYEWKQAADGSDNLVPRGGRPSSPPRVRAGGAQGKGGGRASPPPPPPPPPASSRTG